MSFETYEESQSQGQPVDLYYCAYGSTPDAYFAYTDHDEAIVLGDVTYLPIPIKRGNFVASGTLDKSKLTINLPMSSGLANLFRIYPPGQVITCIIRQGHIGDPDNEYLVIWTGRIINCERGNSEATMTCEPVSTSMRRSGLRRNYQYGCPHVLYQQGDGLCNANKAAATETATVVTAAGNRITLADGWNAHPVEQYRTGMVEWDAARGREYRTILKLEGSDNTLVLSGPTDDVSAGMTISVVLGCPHDMTGCAAIHSNILNYGGHPWIPTENPINKNPFS